MNEAGANIEHPKTQWQVAGRQLRRNRPAMTGFLILALLYLAMMLAPYLAPYPEAFSDSKKNFHPPVLIHFVDAQGRFFPRPFVYNYREFPLYSRHYVPDTRQIYPVHFFSKSRFFSVDPPARLFLFGSDDTGRDVFSRILFGSRIALTIGIAGVAVSYGLGVFIGALSGFYAGKPILRKPRIDLDNWIQRSGEMVMMFPSLYLLLALRALIPDNLSSVAVYFLITILLSFLHWPAIARIVRGLVLSIRENEYVTAAEAVGCSHWRIIVRHIVPNTLSEVVVLMTLSIPGFILGEAFLSFLDLGIREPHASWGNMLTQAQDVVALMHYPWILLPGFFIFITVLSFNLLGDGLRDALDPRMRGLQRIR